MTTKSGEYRRAKANARYMRSDAQTGRLVKLVADELGVITIATDEERRAADAFGLPITRLPRLDNDEVTKLKKEKT